jgi:transcriptional regulator with XRE-family HTH domain
MRTQSNHNNVAQFARDMGVKNAQFIHDIENGKKRPTLKTIIKYYKVLHKSFEELLSPILEIPQKNEDFKSIIKKLEEIQDYPEQWQSLKTIINSFYKDIISILPKKVAGDDSQT